jgi:hypothetical protein
MLKFGIAGVVAELLRNGILVLRGHSRMVEYQHSRREFITIYKHGRKLFNSKIKAVAELLRNEFCNVQQATMGETL